MNQIWSEHIQGTMTLYLSRKLRFHDLFFGQYEPLFALDRQKPLRILEIGCGPGALAGALHRWYPNAEIVALDRDSRFIRFARENEPGVEFLEGDATALPFDSASFDVTISNTVCEHIDPAAFFPEQKRVLKDGGVCLVLSARKGIRQRAKCLEETPEELSFWGGIQDDSIEKYGVGKYSMTEQELPAAMEAYGFSDVSTGYSIIDLTPDDPKYSAEMAEAIINAERYSQIEAVRSTHAEGASRITEMINAKYDTRIQQYRCRQKQWDTETSVTMVLRGKK